jgi:hypothetical protein
MLLNLDMLLSLWDFDISSLQFKDVKRNPKYRTAMLKVKARRGRGASLDVQNENRMTNHSSFNFIFPCCS